MRLSRKMARARRGPRLASVSIAETTPHCNEETLMSDAHNDNRAADPLGAAKPWRWCTAREAGCTEEKVAPTTTF